MTTAQEAEAQAAKGQGARGQGAAEGRDAYWRKNLRITGVLLVIWFVVTFVVGYFARELSFDFFGWPFAFYVGAQGALIVYVLLIWYYARCMDRLDREYDVDEKDD